MCEWHKKIQDVSSTGVLLQYKMPYERPYATGASLTMVAGSSQCCWENRGSRYGHIVTEHPYTDSLHRGMEGMSERQGNVKNHPNTLAMVRSNIIG